MLYLNEVVRYLPPLRRSVGELAEELRFSAQDVSVYQKVYGLRDIAVAEEEKLSSFLDKALAQIVPSERAGKERIKYLLHCHAAPCVAPTGTNLVGALKKKYGLQHAVSVGVAQDQCATPLTVLNVADILLERESADAQILILTGELNFHARLRVIPNTTIVGDAAAASLVGKQGERNAVQAVAQRKFEMASVQPATSRIPVPATSYGDDLMAVVREALDRSGLSADDIALIVAHNVNTISWKFFARNFPFPADRIFLDNVAAAGHCFTSDPFINYCDAVQSGRLKPGDYFLMVSVGTSSTFAAAVVRH